MASPCYKGVEIQRPRPMCRARSLYGEKRDRYLTARPTPQLRGSAGGEGSACLWSSTQELGHLLLTVRGVPGGAQRRGHLLNQREQATALIGAERRTPRHVRQNGLLYLPLQFLAGRGEGEP